MKAELNPKVAWGIAIVLVVLVLYGGFAYLNSATTYNEGAGKKPPGAPPPPAALPPHP